MCSLQWIGHKRKRPDYQLSRYPPKEVRKRRSSEILNKINNVQKLLKCNNG